VGDVVLQQVNVFKYLGFLVTPGLHFSAHITRVKERARAAAYVTSQLVSRLHIFDLSRLRVYFQCYVESQFYGMELLPASAADALCSVRSQFLRFVFDLPRSTNHELAVVLLDLPPVDVLFFRRKSSFYGSIARHEFPFVRQAVEIDRADLINSPVSFHHTLVRLLRVFVPSISTAQFSTDQALATVSELLSDPDLSFYFILRSDSDTLSFFRLFQDPTVLTSFREFLTSLTFQHRRLVILFAGSLLRYRFCATICEFCPLCGKRWVWEHFFTCRRLDVTAIDAPSSVLSIVQTHIGSGQWDVFLQYLRFYLLEWREILATAVFPHDVIDSLC
jgi:hypothetical protein